MILKEFTNFESAEDYVIWRGFHDSASYAYSPTLFGTNPHYRTLYELAFDIEEEGGAFWESSTFVETGTVETWDDLHGMGTIILNSKNAPLFFSYNNFTDIDSNVAVNDLVSIVYKYEGDLKVISVSKTTQP